MIYGEQKYASWNWAKGMTWSRVYNSFLRHVAAIYDGERKDPESGLDHASHAACCLVFLAGYQFWRNGVDDRPVGAVLR